jgi:membrane associated rhomboid family serine protease
MDRDPVPAFPPPPPATERCYRHPDVETGVHCTRCGKAICPACMIPAPVGHHCPDCVAEAKREFRQGPGRQMALGSLRRGASVTSILLAAIAAVYVLEVVAGGAARLFEGPPVGRLIDLGASIGCVPDQQGTCVAGIATGQWWRLGSAMFLHAGILHLAMNSWGLYLFGNVEEREVGAPRFLLIYVASGVVAGAASYAFGQPAVVGVGASGAIYGLLGAFVTYNWRRRHLAFFRARLNSIMPWIVLNLVLSFSLPFIDWRAHVGGLFAGGVAGFVAEGAGSASQRRLILIVGFLGLFMVAAGLVVWRTAQLHSEFPGSFPG